MVYPKCERRTVRTRISRFRQAFPKVFGGQCRGAPGEPHMKGTLKTRIGVTRTNVPATLGILGFAAIGFGLYMAQAFTGPLTIPRKAGDYGRPGYTLGAPAYPREATDAEGYVVAVARPTRRIASLYWSIDEYVYSVVPPANVVAVSESALSRRMSNVYELAEKFQPVVGENAEVLLKVDPDFILAPSERTADFTNILRSAGMPVFRMFMMLTTLDEVVRNILVTGYLTGEVAKARVVYDDFRRAVQRASVRKPPGAPSPRILGFGGRYIYGDQTLFHDIVRTVGGINVGAENGLRGYDSISAERILRWNPDWIVAGSAKGESASVLRRLIEDPALGLTTAAKEGQILVFEDHIFLPMSPFTALLLDALSEALYANKNGA